MYSEEYEILAVDPQDALEGTVNQLAEKYGFELGVTDYFVSPVWNHQFCNQKNELRWRVRIDFVNPDQEDYNGCERGEVSYPED
jgi:hypothetical protein